MRNIFSRGIGTDHIFAILLVKDCKVFIVSNYLEETIGQPPLELKHFRSKMTKWLTFSTYNAKISDSLQQP